MSASHSPEGAGGLPGARKRLPGVLLVVIGVVLAAGGFIAGQAVASSDEPAVTSDAADTDADEVDNGEDRGDANTDGPDSDVDGDGGDNDDDRTRQERLEDVADELAEGQEARHVALVDDLTDAAETAQQELLPLLAQLHDAVPVGGGEGDPAEADQIAEWADTVETAEAQIREVGQGTTAVNGARGSFLSAVRQLDAAVEAYAQAQAFDGEQRAAMVSLTSRLRDSAVSTWTVGGEQLDLLNIAANNGHTHLFLPETGDPGSLPNEFREPVSPDGETFDDHDHDHDDHDDGGDDHHDESDHDDEDH